jgi:flagellar motor switch protein FliN/FliY
MSAVKTPAPVADVTLEQFHLLNDVPVMLYAEVDHRRISVKELLEMQVDSILELPKPAGENINLYAGDVFIGTGEILVVDSSLSVRVADIKDKAPETVADAQES